jgi:hypothetical protein
MSNEVALTFSAETQFWNRTFIMCRTYGTLVLFQQHLFYKPIVPMELKMP